MRQRKTTEEKKLNGTLQECRETMRKEKAAAIEDPVSELAECIEVLEAMRRNQRLATADIRKRGLMVTTIAHDNNGTARTVERINPSVKVQREAVRACASLRKQIAALREEVKERDDDYDDVLAQAAAWVEKYK